MATKGKASEVGETEPTENSKLEMDNLVDDVLGAPSDSTQELKKEESLEDTQEDTEPLNPEEPKAEEPAETEESEETASEDVEEDVIPKSKYQKTLDKMQKRIDQLVAEREDLRSKQETSSSQDSKLEALNVQELKELRENVDEALLDAKVDAKVNGTDVTARVNELKELKRNIDKTVTAAPKRFVTKQIQNLDSMIDEVKDIDPAIVDKKGELWEIANAVYKRMPSLAKSETGMAEALATATEYFVEKKSLNSGRERTTTLSKKVASLKKKTTLDGKTRQANENVVSSKKLRDKAVRGSYYDKLAFVSKELVPDSFLQPQ